MRAAAGHANHDSFVAKVHSEKLHAAYAGDKNLITFEGDHNSHRPPFFYDSVLFFLKAVLQLGNDVTPGDAAETAAEAGCAAMLSPSPLTLPQEQHIRQVMPDHASVLILFKAVLQPDDQITPQNAVESAAAEAGCAAALFSPPFLCLRWPTSNHNSYRAPVLLRQRAVLLKAVPQLDDQTTAQDAAEAPAAAAEAGCIVTLHIHFLCPFPTYVESSSVNCWACMLPFLKAALQLSGPLLGPLLLAVIHGIYRRYISTTSCLQCCMLCVQVAYSLRCECRERSVNHRTHAERALGVAPRLGGVSGGAGACMGCRNVPGVSRVLHFAWNYPAR